MLEKFTFEKKLGIDSSEKKWIGLKIGTVSGIIAFCGALVAWVGLGKLGYWIVAAGILGGVVGLILHFYAMLMSFVKH